MSSQKPGIFPDIVLCYRYSSFIIQGVLRDSSNTLINTTGYKGLFQMRLEATTEQAFVTATVANGKFTFSGADGGFKIKIDPAETQNLKLGQYKMGALIRGPNPTDRVDPLLEGTVEVKDFPAQGSPN